MKVLITGGSGLLGSAVSLYFKDYFDVVSTYTSNKIEITGCKTAYLDVRNIKDTQSFVQKLKPDFVVHAAALVGVGICEKQKELAYNVNVQGTKNITESCKKIKSKIIYISTDYIFDGKKGMYDEADRPSPINFYGETKLKGEESVDTENNIIVRTSIHGWNIIPDKKSFSSWIIDDLTSSKKINCFTDQISSMMLVNNCAEALKELIEKEKTGIYNIASPQPISKYDFALNVAETFNLDKSLIFPVKNQDVNGHEKRPFDTSLDITKSRKELKTKIPNAKESLQKMKELKESNYLKNFRVI